MKKVTVIVPHHLNSNQKYLDLTLDSLSKSTHENLEIICVADTPESPNVRRGIRLIHRPQWDTASKKVNEAVKVISPDTDLIMFVSDDVIVSKECISQMVEAQEKYPCIMIPKSNGDSRSRYITDIELLNKEKESRLFLADCEYEDLMGYYEAALDYPRAPMCLVPQPWVSFFCVMMPKAVWDGIGELDEPLDARHNDEDYCYRSAQRGIHSMVLMNAFAFHFGSKTLKISSSSGEKEEATKYFLNKWGKSHVLS